MIQYFLKIMMLAVFLMSNAALSAAFGDRLHENEQLTKGQWIRSNNGQYTFILQDDGNVVLYGRGRALWASNTNGQAVNNLIMQSDGNLVAYGYPHAIWSSGTYNWPGAYLVMQDDGNAVIYIGRRAIWATGTN